MIVEQLTEVYLKKEYWHKSKLTRQESDEYHERLLLNGNILTYVVKDELIGYLEWWGITYEQFGRLVCGQPILTDREDLLSGNIALINNMWINPDDRCGDAFSILGAMFLTRCNDKDFYVAFRRVKKHQPIQVYSRNEIIKHFKK